MGMKLYHGTWKGMILSINLSKLGEDLKGNAMPCSSFYTYEHIEKHNSWYPKNMK